MVAAVSTTRAGRKDETMGFKPRRVTGLLIALALLALWMLNASQPGVAVEGCLDGCATAARPDDGTLRIVSLNVLHDFPRFARTVPRFFQLFHRLIRLFGCLIELVL